MEAKLPGPRFRYCGLCSRLRKQRHEQSEGYKAQRRFKRSGTPIGQTKRVVKRSHYTRLVMRLYMREYRKGTHEPRYRRLHAEQVRAIKLMLKSGEYAVKDIAARYNVHPSTISKIKHKKTWKRKAPIRPPKYNA